MKKLLLTLAAAVMGVVASFAATTVVIADCNLDSKPTTWEKDGYTFTVDKANGSTAPAYNANGKDLRVYANGTLTIKSTTEMERIKFTISAQGKKRMGPITASVGTVGTQVVGNDYLTWTGKATEVTFTVGDKSDFGSEAGKAAQFCFTEVEFNGDGSTGGDTPTGPMYRKANSITSGSAYVFVASGKYNMLFDKNYGYMSATDLPAQPVSSGFVGDPTYAMVFEAVEGGYTIKTNGGKYLGAKANYNTFDTTDDSKDNRVWTVTFTADLGQAVITNVATGKVIYQDPAYGSFGCYSADATEGKVLPELYVLDGETPEPPVPTTGTFVATEAVTSGSNYVFVATLDGVNKLAAAISQSSSYGRLTLEDVAIADKKLTTELKNAILITAENGGYTLKDSYGRYLGFDGTHTTSFQLYTEVSALCTWNITLSEGLARITLVAENNEGLVGVTKGAEGTWYTNLAPSVGAAEVVLPALYVEEKGAVADIVVDENAPVEYFNLQGIRVANPEIGRAHV